MSNSKYLVHHIACSLFICTLNLKKKFNTIKLQSFKESDKGVLQLKILTNMSENMEHPQFLGKTFNHRVLVSSKSQMTKVVGQLVYN